MKPNFVKFSYKTKPEQIFAFLKKRHSEAFWLDSALTSKGERFSYIGVPYAVFRSRGNRWEFVKGNQTRRGRGNPWVIFSKYFQKEKSEFKNIKTPFPFTAGVVGYIGYEMKNFLESHALKKKPSVGAYDCYVLFVRSLCVWDHRKRLACAEKSFSPLPSEIFKPPKTEGKIILKSSLSKNRYFASVRKIKSFIAKGEIYQANLTRRLSFKFNGDPLALFLSMRRANPAPYCAYLSLGGTQILSASPELFLSVKDGVAVSSPMKGTAPRGKNKSEDAKIRRALAVSEKNRAENLMIVDLVRNDLGRVTKVGSVRVKNLFKVTPYRTLYQMTSDVHCALEKNIGALEALKALFPPGSMTGAPKISAVDILESLEPTKRDVYSGALGYIDFSGDAKWSVVIRTLVCRGGRGYFHTGGGIVADSSPEGEWRESVLKSQVLLKSLKKS